MSCAQDATRLARVGARLTAGIEALAGQRGFYAGLALGGAGLLGAGLLALARRQSRARATLPRVKERSKMIDPRQIPELPERMAVTPSPVAAGSCAGCQTPAGAKPGPWYPIGGRQYCQDCAPTAARQAGVDLVSARARRAGMPEGGGTQRQRGRGEEGSSLSSPASLRPSSQEYLAPERRVETRLAPSRLGLNLGSEREPAPFVVDSGYVLIRPDGSDTGLALTPHLVAETGAGGEPTIREDLNRWWITHIPSGRAVTGRPYDKIEQAQLLGNVLAQLDWTRGENEFSPDEYRRAGATVALFERSLAEAESSAPAQPAPTTRRLPSDESFEGKLVADGYGGIARVLADGGETLFLVDSLGQRYELSRREARTPDESDFELCRVAMSFDPAGAPEASCATCRRSTRQTGAGEMWYKMGWQAFCETCAGEYAVNEGYIMEEDVDDSLEALPR